MTVLLDKDLLYSTFNTSSFEKLEASIDSVAPSMAEYYLNDISTQLNNEPSYINKTNIQNTIYIDQYTLYYDYNDDVYLEFQEKEDTFETESLW